MIALVESENNNNDDKNTIETVAIKDANANAESKPEVKSLSIESQPYEMIPNNNNKTWLDKYINFLYKYKYMLVAFSWVLILVGGFIGKDAFSGLQNGGFVPPKCESTAADDFISKN